MVGFYVMSRETINTIRSCLYEFSLHVHGDQISQDLALCTCAAVERYVIPVLILNYRIERKPHIPHSMIMPPRPQFSAIAFPLCTQPSSQCSFRTTHKLPIDRRRTISTYGYTQAKSLVYSQHGSPADVLSCVIPTIPFTIPTTLFERITNPP